MDESAATVGGRRSPTWPGGGSPVVGVIGDPVAHSLSPLLHNAAFDALGLDWVSVAFPVPGGQADRALVGMRALGIAGLSVTMPHKDQAFECVDDVTDTARRLRAVNCVTRRSSDGALVGDSTDGPGLVLALRRGAGFEPAGRRCLVVGAGGAARAIVLALAEAGAAEVVVVNRTAARAEVAAALAGDVGRVGAAADAADVDLLVQATSVGMAGVGSSGDGALPIDPERLRPGQVVVDIVVHPPRTALLEAAARRGAVAVGGLGMLVHQAALALGQWTGRPAPVEAMWAAARSRPGSAGGR